MARSIIRGRMDIHPPRQIGKGSYTILVPKVDRDGNDVPGIRLPVSKSLGTYTGWNLLPRRLAEDELSGLLALTSLSPKPKPGDMKQATRVCQLKNATKTRRITCSSCPGGARFGGAAIFTAGRR